MGEKDGEHKGAVGVKASILSVKYSAGAPIMRDLDKERKKRALEGS
jgi:hypothetical protein